jgi:uncharacterized membrane protein HdeD (DUF308 family)
MTFRKELLIGVCLTIGGALWLHVTLFKQHTEDWFVGALLIIAGLGFIGKALVGRRQR